MTGYSCALSSAVVTALGQLLMSLSALGVMGFGAAAVIADEISIGALIATMALTWRILTPLQSGFLAVPRIRQVLKSMHQIDQLMKISVERDGAQSGLLNHTMIGDVVLDRVSMRYGQEENPALLGVSMQAKAGQIVAIVGDSGSGKSSLLKLIAGMYRPQTGALYLDDQDLRQLNVKELRRSVAYVPQDVRLFHGTIAQNLRLNNSAATLEELKMAAQQAGIANDIARLADGYSTKIGDNTTDRFAPAFLRGLTLARALLRPAKVLLLDEPGAGMDEESDLLFQEQLKQLRGNRTVIMATHRPSHARLADKVLYLEHGTVKFFGEPAKAIAQMLRKTQ
jgi:ATP-binding cassette subfamily C protein/ATP-binding cassette subfamily C protein LapB